MTGIISGFILLAILLLWFVIGAKGHWFNKAAMILVSLYFCLSVGLSVSEFMGWPTDKALPEKFLVHWAVIDEPDVKSGSEGSIYVWVRHLSNPEKEYDEWNDYLLSFYDGESRPRAYRLSYSRGLHERTQEAIDMLTKGEGVGGTSEGEGKEGDGEGLEGEGTEEGEGGGSLTRNGGIMFHKLPPPKLPDKR